ncbi:hypothetical protein BN7_5893 [Wickerhamomyces ciferrii]|uniref:Dienelactone hydrolase domain-containing protein n=1 Tax=Wickerhamomyces ciferrii (strain ATCC 14091 / BCRC 22168 / CBS 111 / JCM 3599 / NBRC 0793 / NRRL Y-1031 F-60-10) TaxID=1206466 RepID=K0KT35_WICCF|nr:uncharacterized protein BN7_5893 [Wickerhamomyces ciferrii]CCH46301.1 hypothetical protein BN7_5893 [Wickerhamomyces ciferrii]
MSSKDQIRIPKSAYPKAYPEFDSSFMDDSIEGDISLSRDFNDAANSSTTLNGNINDLNSLNSNDSFDDILESPISSKQQSTIFKEPQSPKPRGYEFKLKSSNCTVYLTYPVTNIDIDNYGKVDYELHTKENAMVVIIPNSKGLSVNNKKLADAYAIRTGCVTAVLDVYFGDFLDQPTVQPNDELKEVSFIDRFKNLTFEMAANVKIQYWIQSHSFFGSFNESDGSFQSTSNWITVESAIDELLTNHKVTNAVLIGFSFGCNTVLRSAVDNKDDRIKSIIAVHPLLIPKNVFEHINKSTFLITGPPDKFYSNEELQKYRQDLKGRNDPDYKYLQFTSKKDIPHGFAIAGDYPPMKVSNFPTQTAQHITSWILQHI